MSRLSEGGAFKESVDKKEPTQQAIRDQITSWMEKNRSVLQARIGGDFKLAFADHVNLYWITSFRPDTAEILRKIIGNKATFLPDKLWHDETSNVFYVRPEDLLNILESL